MNDTSSTNPAVTAAATTSLMAKAPKDRDTCEQPQTER